MVWGPRCTLWLEELSFPKGRVGLGWVGALVQLSTASPSFLYDQGDTWVTLLALCFFFFITRKWRKKKTQGPKFSGPTSPWIKQEMGLRKIKTSHQAQPLCELFVDHDSRVVTLLESIFLSDLKSSLLCCTMWKWKYQLSFLALPSI